MRSEAEVLAEQIRLTVDDLNELLAAARRQSLDVNITWSNRRFSVDEISRNEIL